MMRRLHTALMALAIVVPLTACSSAIRQPEVRLDGVRVGAVGLRGGTLVALVHVTNPNSFDIETRELNYDLQLPDPDNAGEWISFTKGALDERMQVRGGSSTVIEVPIQFRYEDFGGALSSILDTGTFNYRVRGDVRVTEPIGRTVPFTKTGTVSMSGIR